MNYIGSKLRLLEFLDESITSIVDKDCKTFCDLFAGTGIVGKHFKKLGYEIISNDLQYYSYVLNRHLIVNNDYLNFTNLNNLIPNLLESELKNKSNIVCDYLSKLPKINGFIYDNYCSGGTINKEHTRLYFSDINGQICDSIRIEIENWKNNLLINENEYFFLLASLIESVDKKANTTSVYGAFLKNFKKSALNLVKLESLEIIESDKNNKVFNMDANILIKEITPDILYLDPPYNNRVYGDNYHILETIAKYDNPEIKGVTGNRLNKTVSKYSRKTEVKNAFKELIKNANSKYIFVSYNNEGLLSLEEIKEIMSTKGEYGLFTKKYQRYKSDINKNKEDGDSLNRNYSDIETFEYLHYVKCV
jgi:adenine-specific DNA-methyltransferase